MSAAVFSMAALVAPGCGPNCQSACFKIYAEAECDVSTPGQSWEDAYKDCVEECDNALSQPGDLAGFDPDERNTSGESVTLENEQQAAAWMDCVEETACERLEEGYCAH
jgi:hypothetical protein